MTRLLFITILLISSCHAADHDTFKDCSRVQFCNTLRSRTPDNKYVVDPSSVTATEEIDVVTLSLIPNDGSSNLTLVINVLKDKTIRIRIKEVGSRRYQLQDVLDGEPSTSNFMQMAYSTESLSLTVNNLQVYIIYRPFDLGVFQNDIYEFWLQGSRLTFESDLDQAFAFGVSFPEALQLYGIHEHANKLALEATQTGGKDPYRLRNLDVAGYELDSPMALYGSIPVLYGHGPQATAGIFLHNAAEQWVEIYRDQYGYADAYFMVESGSLDLFILSGPTITKTVRQYVGLTGTAHLPQLWTLGYHQSRWNYDSQDDLKDVVANFNAYNFPLDVIWLDIEYTDGKKYFTWNSDAFSDPEEMQQNISTTHKRLVTIIDPHIKVEQGYNVYDGALENDLFVKTANGSNFEGDCWPGLSSYMDFLNPKARDYYASFYSFEKFPHTTPVLSGIWNDMNEPSVFDDSLEKTLPGDSVHYGGVLHRDIHNIYGLLHTMSTHQGLMQRDNGTKRPFVLTRSHFAGTQRYSAIWTGDNTADWAYLSVSYDECLNANLLGIVFCGADVGGFFNDPNVELLQRWYQAGAWLPFYRAHANSGTQRREPYLFDDDVKDVIRNAIELRYKHLPTWYTLFYEHTRNKDPIIRPLFYQYPQDENVYKLSDHLLVGNDILVRAVAEPGVQSVQVYFPGGSDEHWISITDSTVYEGNGFADIAVDIQSIPVYYRRGSIIFRKDTIGLSSDEMTDIGYTLYLNLNANGAASGTVYLDDRTSFNYASNKEYNYLKVSAVGSELAITKIDEDANSDAFEFVVDKVVLNEVKTLPQDGKPGTFEKTVYTKDVTNNLLSNLSFKGAKTITIKLA